VIVSSDVRMVGWQGLANRDIEVPDLPATRRSPGDAHDRSLLDLLFVIELFWVSGVIWLAVHSL
jgi:hypothetical protein